MVNVNVCYIVNDRTDDWFRFSVLQSAKIANRFVFVVDRPDAGTWDVLELAQSLKPTVILHSKYLHESKNADGTFRSVYLDWLKLNADGGLTKGFDPKTNKPLFLAMTESEIS